MSHPDAFGWNPIPLLERMATADDVVACPATASVAASSAAARP